MNKLVKTIRDVEIILGDKVKKPTKSENKNIIHARKSLVAKTDIKIGDTFSNKNLTSKRPGNGMSPMDWDKLIGTKALKSYKSDELIKGNLMKKAKLKEIFIDVFDLDPFVQGKILPLKITSWDSLSTHKSDYRH